MYSQDEKDKMAMKNSTIDKFAARGGGGGDTGGGGGGDRTNRGDRMAMRGERKIDRGEEKISGDRMAARGQRKIDKAEEKIVRATDKLGNKLINKADRAYNKVARIEARAGGFPTLGQSERISAQKSKANKAAEDRMAFLETPKYRTMNSSRIPVATAGPFDKSDVNLASKKQAKGLEKIYKGERLVKKGEMLSARINNRRKG